MLWLSPTSEEQIGTGFEIEIKINPLDPEGYDRLLKLFQISEHTVKMSLKDAK